MATTPTRAAFLASVPGSMFNAAPVEVIDQALADAAAMTNASLFQSTALADRHIFLQAAIALLMHPGSLKMRQANPDQVYVWERQLRDAQRSATLGVRTF
jgi:hypothetical protein